jgi:transposase
MSHVTPQTWVHLDPPADPPAELQIAGAELLALIKDAVATVQTLPAHGQDSLVDRKPCAPKSLLTLLVYCYALGIYGSRQIEEKIRTDETLRAVSGGCQPDHQLLNQFRPRHRDAIQCCLKRVYWFLWVKHRIQKTEFVLSVDHARGKRVRVSPHFSKKIEAEASESIARSVFLDQMMAD